MGTKNRVAYTSSNGALVVFTRAMAVEYMNDPIRVNCICPGTTDTPSLADRFSVFPDPEAARQQFIQQHHLGCFAKPEEIADRILHLTLAEFCTATI
jgi:NAD(P)-dependent dehydrogenase (short-subunit alcohol dehydrogenase family)